jgi:hypothetical protein
MGAYSTLQITRGKALGILMAKLLGDITDGQLEDMMDEHLSDRLYNCMIVGDNCECNDDDKI